MIDVLTAMQIARRVAEDQFTYHEPARHGAAPRGRSRMDRVSLLRRTLRTGRERLGRHSRDRSRRALPPENDARIGSLEGGSHACR